MNPRKSPSGYDRKKSSWHAFLHCWEQQILAGLAGQETFYAAWEKEARKRMSMRFEPASARQLGALETRLNVQLPWSYKDFLSVTNGWIQIGFDADDALVLSVEQVGYLKQKDPELIEDWLTGSGGLTVSDEDYFVYGETQDTVAMRDEYLQDAIMISEVADAGIYLLNPRVVSLDGEFEAWFFGWELPGAVRFRSFADLMRNAYYLACVRDDSMFPYGEAKLRGTCADHIIVHRENINFCKHR